MNKKQLAVILFSVTTLLLYSINATAEEDKLYNFDWEELKESFDETVLVAEAQEGAEAEEPLSSECEEFAKDPDADLGEVLKAGCEPTLA